MTNLRTLQFANLDEAVQEVRALHHNGYTSCGEWSLGQICRHLTLVQTPSVDGYPAWMSLFAFMRPAMRRWLLPKLRRPDSPRGIRTASIFVPPDQVDDQEEVEAFARCVDRFHAHHGEYAPHPAFGRMSRAEIEEIHTLHAAHHLRFLRHNES